MTIGCSVLLCGWFCVLGFVDKAEALSKKLKMGDPVDIGNGITYREIKVGTGVEPNPGDTVTIHFSLFCGGVEVETSRDSQGLAARPLGFTWGTERGPGSMIKGVLLVSNVIRNEGSTQVYTHLTCPRWFCFCFCCFFPCNASYT